MFTKDLKAEDVCCHNLNMCYVCENPIWSSTNHPDEVQVIIRVKLLGHFDHKTLLKTICEDLQKEKPSCLPALLLDYTVTTAHNGQLCGIFGDGVNIPPNCATIGQRLLMHYFISHKEGQQHFLFRIKNYTPNFMDRLFHLWLIPKKKLQFSLELELISSYVVLWSFLATVTDTWN